MTLRGMIAVSINRPLAGNRLGESLDYPALPPYCVFRKHIAVAINFACPHCNAPQSAEERYAGLTGPCTACGKMMTVPGGAGVSAGKAAAAGVGIGSVFLIVGIVTFVVMLGCGGVLLALLLPAVQAARQAARRMASSNNEKNIMLALHNYHDTHGEFPPAVIKDKDGKPMHSWRVLILPYIEQQGLYSQYDMNQPWDSPQNMQVANSMPQVYRSPLDTSNKPNSNITSYLLFAGKGTVFGEEGKASIGNITDGTSNTVALTEVDNSGIIWTQPVDLDAEKLDFVIRDMRNQQPGQINSEAGGGVMMGFFDGSVRFMSSQTNPQELRSAVDPKDGRAPLIDFGP